MLNCHFYAKLAHVGTSAVCTERGQWYRLEKYIFVHILPNNDIFIRMYNLQITKLRVLIVNLQKQTHTNARARTHTHTHTNWTT